MVAPVDESAAPGMPESRTGAFSLGMDSQRFNAQVPKGAGHYSVLQSPLPGLNGMSQQDYESRVLPGGMTLPSSNGMGASTYQQAMIMRLQGNQDEI